MSRIRSLLTQALSLEATEEASQRNWDGYGANPVRGAALQEARILLEALPTDLPLPEIAVEPDGSIGLEWRVGRNRGYVLSLSGTGEAEYAGIFGPNETHGKEIFCGTLPAISVDHLRRLYTF